MTHSSTSSGFRHEALLYTGEDEFVRGTGGFVEEGLAAGEAILVVVSAAKIARLRARLGSRADAIHFADMAEIGRNPARIIPAWQKFVSAHSGTSAGTRGIGEPIDPWRSPDALIECERHEALLNVAFDGSPSWLLLCPYDTEALPPAVIDEALRNHPYVRNGDSRPNPHFRGLEDCAAPLDLPLPEPPPRATTFHVGLHTLAALRELVARHAADHRFESHEIDSFVLSVHELATNTVRHGGGSGTVRLWGSDTEIVADVRDRGRIEHPLVGRVEPALDAASGRGLWLANQLSDLVQIRAYPDGGAVRVRLYRR